MEGKLIIHYDANNESLWDELYEIYTRVSLTDFVDIIRKHYPECVCEPCIEEILEITDCEGSYILCDYDGMAECVSIYERLNIYEELPF